MDVQSTVSPRNDLGRSCRGRRPRPHSLPRTSPNFLQYLEGLVDAGFGKRVMFGSDQMVWPGVIERAIDRIEGADFLSAEQKRDIVYNNAARLFRLSQEEIDRHHGR